MSTLGDDGDDGDGIGGGGGGDKGRKDGRPPPPPPKRVKPAGGAGGDGAQAEWELPAEDLDAQPHQDGQGAGAGAGADAPAEQGVQHSYLVMPGNYSGDSWHIAAAMLLDPNLRVVIPTKDAGEFNAITNQTIAFLQAAGIAGDRIIRDNGLSHLRMVSPAHVAACARAAIEHLEGDGADPVTGWTFASTSVIADAIAQRGAPNVQQQLRNAFAVDPGDGRFDGALGTIRQLAAADPPRPVLLVNMRRGVRGNHPQHNITEAILRQICQQAQAAGQRVVCVGGFQNAHNTPGAQWMQGDGMAQYGPIVEIFPPGQRADRSATAHFWSQIQALQAAGQVSGVIGGRSGSLDVAAFMGVRTFCWDVQNAADHEYARLCIAQQLMSIGQRDNPNAHATDPRGRLNDNELQTWLGGQDVAPHIPPGNAFNYTCTLQQLGNEEARRALLMREPVQEEEEDDDGGGDDDPHGDQGGAGDDEDGGGDEDGDRRRGGDAPGGAGLMFGAPAPFGAPSDMQLQAMALQRAFAPPLALVPPSVAALAAPMDGVVEGPLPPDGPPRGRDRSRAVNTNSLRERSDRSRSPQRAPDGAGRGRERERSRRRRSRSRSPE